MDEYEDTGIISTEVNQMFAYVKFSVEGKEYKMRIRTKLLKKQKAFFGDEDIHLVEMENWTLTFPMVQTIKKVSLLRTLWDEFADYGFEMVGS